MAKETVKTTAPKAEKAESKAVKVRVTTPFLNVREGAGINFPVIDTVKADAEYEITTTAKGVGASEWGKLKTGGWVSLDYAVRI